MPFVTPSPRTPRRTTFSCHIRKQDDQDQALNQIKETSRNINANLKRARINEDYQKAREEQKESYLSYKAPSNQLSVALKQQNKLQIEVGHHI